MSTCYWACRRRQKVGPFPTREEAVAAFVLAYPVKGPSYQQQAKANAIMTGYGSGGPWADVRWFHADGTPT